MITECVCGGMGGEIKDVSQISPGVPQANRLHPQEDLLEKSIMLLDSANFRHLTSGISDSRTVLVTLKVPGLFLSTNGSHSKRYIFADF